MPSTRTGSQFTKADNRLIIIANPTAGVSAGRTNRQRLIESAQRDLERAGFHVDVGLENSSDAVVALAEHAVRKGYRYVVAAGGDGTVNSVVNGIMRLGEHSSPRNAALLKEVAFGVIPLGTGNVFAFNMR
ncbi:MAG: acylglycerol kinase family protein, partial [Abitibacteriaceae bacterium]|nr:acylglycerol kinase family protein [Abditibacteriaceae bacterium]